MTLRLDENRPSGTEATAVLVEDDAFTQQRRPRQEVGEPCIAIAVFGEVHHCRPRSN